MGTPTVSQKIDAYAKAHLAELKKKQGLKNFTKYDIAEIMLKSGALTQAEMNSWRSTREGFSANNRSGSVFGSGYAGQESYLDEMTDFSQKSTFEKNLEIMNPTKLRYETPKQRKTRQAQYKQHVQDQQTSARIKNTKAYQNQEAMKKYLATLPPCTESYEELIASQKFESLDKSGKIKFLMETTGRKFYEAMEKGDKSAMRKYAIEGMSYVFAYMDDKSGITDIKDAVKKYSGLNALVDVVDKIVDDGDADNLSGAEKTWATIKGAGDAVDGFIGTQGIAVMGSLFLAGEAAAAAGMAKLFAVATQAYFGIEGATLVYEGGKEIADATTEEQARTGGTKLTSGAIMLAGTVKSVKQGYENYKASQAHKADIANARKTLGLEGDAPLTEASIKAAKKSLALANHPDRGGSVEAMQNINDAASLLLKELKGGTLATTTASTADPKADASKAMSELAKTPEGVKQMEDAGLVAPKKKSTYVKPEVSTTELASKEDVASSAFEKPIWKNTVISKQARADVKFVKEQYGLDIDVLRDNKVKIGNEVFDCGNLDKGEIATAVKVAYEGVEPTWGTKFNTQQFSLAEKIYAKKFQSDYKNRVIKEMPIQIRNEAAEWFDNNFNPKTSLAGNFAERRDFYCYPNDYTKSKAIKFADYSAANAIIEPWVAVRLELLAKKGYEIVVHGRETRDDSVTSDIEVISPSGKVTIVHHTERGVRDMDAILQELTNSQ